MNRLLALVAAATVTATFGSGCHASAKASLKSSSDVSSDEPSTFSDAPAPTASAAAPPPAASSAPVTASAPPADACPLACFEANGASRVDVSAEEQAQLRSALEPVLANMRACSSTGDSRRRGSAVINLRIGPDGTLADLGIDPHHGGENGCLDHAANGTSVSLSLPGRKVVRCAERCQAEPAARKARRRR
ncbi:MAG: hypothetical protein JWP97_5467 [Labilithrix sp.]|nr:hypothetical protein [Labilithrix sp.]